MKKFLTDIHTHSLFSFDGISTLDEMIAEAFKRGVDFYGVSEHIDHDIELLGDFIEGHRFTDEEEYFHKARHLQDDYAGCMNVFVGAEFGFTDDEAVLNSYRETVKKYAPDFVIFSVHTLRGNDYYYRSPYYKTVNGERIVRDKEEVYAEYFANVKKSVEADFPFDIIGHIGYATRYAPYQDRGIEYEKYPEVWDGILKSIIERGKILEVNTSNSLGVSPTLPDRDIIKRYFELGGREVSYGSDAHDTTRILNGREAVVKMLKEIGFTYITVPFRGEKIKIEL